MAPTAGGAVGAEDDRRVRRGSAYTLLEKFVPHMGDKTENQCHDESGPLASASGEMQAGSQSHAEIVGNWGVAVTEGESENKRSDPTACTPGYDLGDEMGIAGSERNCRHSEADHLSEPLHVGLPVRAAAAGVEL